MEKHCNIILLDEQNIIIDSLRHISTEDELSRNIVPHTKYTFPTSSKLNFMDLKNFDEFKSIVNCNNYEDLAKSISDKFTGISTSFINSTLKYLKMYYTITLEKLFLK